MIRNRNQIELRLLNNEKMFLMKVINIVTGTGSEIGQAISDHPRIRKLGFTGSTEIGSHIMSW